MNIKAGLISQLRAREESLDRLFDPDRFFWSGIKIGNVEHVFRPEGNQLIGVQRHLFGKQALLQFINRPQALDLLQDNHFS
jgi:hypothetical protein